MNEYYIITFRNTHEAINAENQAEKNNVNVTIIPTPTYITRSCGISIMVDKSNFNIIDDIINNGDIKFKNIYFKDNDSYQLIK